VLDEAYHAFAGRRSWGGSPSFEHGRAAHGVELGLAGIRLGYLAGRPEWIQQFNKLRSPYNVNVLTQAAALFLLERVEVLEEQAARIRKERTSLGSAIAALRVSRYFLPRRTSSCAGA